MSRCRSGLALAAALFASMGSAIVWADEVEDEDQATIRVVAEGYRANRTAFSAMTLRCRVTHGKADSVEKALAGDWRPEHRVVGEGFYSFDGRTHRQDLIYPPEASEKYTRQVGRTVTSMYTPIMQVCDRELVAQYHPRKGGSVNVGSIQSQPLGDALLVRPFDWGTAGMNGARTFDVYLEEDVLEGKGPAKTTYEPSTIAGRPCWLLTRSAKGQLWGNIWTDPERGFLPLRSDSYANGRLQTVIAILDVEACSQQRWFPRRVMLVFVPPQASEPVSFREVNYYTIDVDHPPSPDNFKLALPKGTAIIVGGQSLNFAGKGGVPLTLELNRYRQAALKSAERAAQAGNGALAAGGDARVGRGWASDPITASQRSLGADASVFSEGGRGGARLWMLFSVAGGAGLAIAGWLVWRAKSG